MCASSAQASIEAPPASSVSCVTSTGPPRREGSLLVSSRRNCWLTAAPPWVEPRREGSRRTPYAPAFRSRPVAGEPRSRVPRTRYHIGPQLDGAACLLAQASTDSALGAYTVRLH